MKALWAHLITREKALFKSLTMWLAAILAATPDMLSFAQANFPGVAPYLPRLLQDQGMKWIALAIFLCRLKSLVRLPPPTPLPAPANEAVRP